MKVRNSILVNNLYRCSGANVWLQGWQRLKASGIIQAESSPLVFCPRGKTFLAFFFNGHVKLRENLDRATATQCREVRR